MSTWRIPTKKDLRVNTNVPKAVHVMLSFFSELSLLFLFASIPFFSSFFLNHGVHYPPLSISPASEYLSLYPDYELGFCQNFYHHFHTFAFLLETMLPLFANFTCILVTINCLLLKMMTIYPIR